MFRIAFWVSCVKVVVTVSKNRKMISRQLFYLKLRFADETLHICSLQGQGSLDCIWGQLGQSLAHCFYI